MNNTVIITLAVLLCLGFFIFLSLCENSRLEKEAVGHGYATYDSQGKFIWKEKVE